ncbi:MAG TPA: signal peptidase I [Candidatus Paceibacterota bacterium]|nr:signal peptidase I [Candidatus Paceibacterota bacterium]
MPQEKHENFFIELLKFALIAVVIVVPLRLFIAKPFIVSGASMEPTFDTGQYLIVDELSYRFGEPARGDVVIFRYPKDPSQYFIKRVIGLPGETVRIQRGEVSVIETNGNAVNLDESYIVHKGNGGDMQVTLKAGEYFVMGDNRPESSDSRIWGVLPREDIVGRAFVRLLPVQTLGLFPGSISSQQ